MRTWRTYRGFSMGDIDLDMENNKNYWKWIFFVISEREAARNGRGRVL